MGGARRAARGGSGATQLHRHGRSGLFTNISRRTWPEHCSEIGIVFHVYIIILILKDGSHVTLIMNPRESCTGADCTVHRHVYWQGFMTQLLNILISSGSARAAVSEYERGLAAPLHGSL